MGNHKGSKFSTVRFIGFDALPYNEVNCTNKATPLIDTLVKSVAIILTATS